MNMTVTTNGMPALASSFNKNVDLFGKIGASRGHDLSSLFTSALRESEDTAIRVLQWARDVRGGAGEREQFRNLLLTLAGQMRFDILERLVPKIPEVGRWDDLFVLIGFNGELDQAVAEEVADALTKKNGLCAKWMPRKGNVAVWFTKKFELTPKQYRKLIVSLTNVVETQMCAKQFDQIEFGKVPSIAASRYQRAFKRNAPVEYGAYVAALQKGEAKINAGAIFPYDVIKGLNGVNGVADAQWKSLPDYMEGSQENVLAVIDVSGSMDQPAGAGSTTCMDVAISLGLYVAERTQGIFRDKFINFHTSPVLMDLSSVKKDLGSRVNYIRRAPWGGSTNIAATFNLILNAAVQHRIPQEQMPTKIMIFSDMQFDLADRNFQNLTAFEMIDAKYKAAGYKRPDIIFWNLNGRTGNTPVTFGQEGTAHVSGFSPALMKQILANKAPTPYSMMMDTVGIERYNW